MSNYCQLICKNNSYKIKKGTELLQAYKADSSLPFKYGCTKGTCTTCLFEVMEGKDNLSPMTKQEKETLALKKVPENCRLACQCSILGDVKIS